MELLIATLCDTASEDQGKLNITGAFDALSASSLPALCSCHLVLRFSFTAEDHGAHPFSISMMTGDKPAAVQSSDVMLNVHMPAGTPGFSTQNLILPLQVQIGEAGVSHFHVTCDGRVLARVPLMAVVQTVEANGAAEAAGSKG